MIGWIDASSGASGDMLLGALLDAGAEEEVIRAAIAAVAPEATALTTGRVRRGGLAATRAQVEVAGSRTHRGLSEVLELVAAAGLDPTVAGHIADVFTRLGEAEAEVHGIATRDVHFHEVGALDAVADIVGVCAGFVSLDLAALCCSPVAVGSGTVEATHGTLSVPVPAVASLLRGIPTYAGPTASELCTPTGAALLRHWATQWGSQPAMSVDAIGVGAGGRDFAGHANVLRLFVGRSGSVQREAGDPSSSSYATRSIVFETNVDDLDPRLWAPILQRLLDAGASDAWLTPILMKKGRPAHTLSVLLAPDRAEDVRRVILTETSAIGLRQQYVGKRELQREVATVEVEGQPIAVKIARLDGEVVNVQPEYEDVVATAAKLDRAIKSVLADAVAASAHLWRG